MEIVKYLLITLIVLLFFTTISYILYDNIYEHIHSDNNDDDNKKPPTVIYNNRYWWYPRWRPPWRRSYNRTCPNGCVFTGDKHDSKSGFACPNGGRCFSNNCCKYDFQCKKCGRILE